MQQNHTSETMLTEQIQCFTLLKHGRTHRDRRPWCSKVWWVDVTSCLTSPAGDSMTLAGSSFHSSWKWSCPESGDKGTSPLSKGSWRRAFSYESTLRMRWPKYWSFSFSIIPSKEHPGPISFRMDWLDLLAVQGTLKSLLQHHSSKAWILQHSAFFTVQLSHPYMTTGQTMSTGNKLD